MGKIKIELPNESFFVEIEGDQPNIKERIAINELVQSKTRPTTTRQRVSSQQSQVDQSFDTETGIQSGMLRAALSAAETAEEEEAILARAGFASEDFIRDRRGRLALTPTGAAKTGMETDKNVLIDEEGFSRYDFADLAGIAPEVTGAIVGAVKTAPLGAPAGPFGVLGAGAVGAAGGAAAGNLFEEGIEGLFGVSKQTAGEIARDTAKEAAIAGGGELLFGAPFAAFKLLSPKPGILKEGGQQLDDIGLAISRDYQPTKRAMGLPPIPAKLEQVTESVIGASPRQVKNSAQMQADLARYKGLIDEAVDTAQGQLAGDFLLEAQALSSQALSSAATNVRASIIGQLDDAVKSVTGSLKKNASLDDDLFALVNNSFQAFTQKNTINFALIDDVMSKSIGQSDILPTNSLKELAESFQQKYGQVSIGGTEQGAKAMADTLAEQINQLGNKASFTTIYKNRENLMKAMYASPKKFGTEYQMQKDVLAALDNILTSSNIETLAKGIGKKFGAESVQALKAAADSIPNARDFYFKGMKRFEDIEAATAGKNIVSSLREGETPSNLAGFGMSLIKNGNKKPLENLRAALGAGPQYQSVKEALGREWMRTTLKNSGFDTANPSLFSSDKFLKAIDDLGETGEELFGGQLAGIRSVAKQMDDLSIGRINQKVLDDAFEAGVDQSVLTGMRNALGAARGFAEVRKPQLLRKLNDGTLEADEALEVFLAPGAKKKEVRAIMNFFERSGNEQAMASIRGAVLDDIFDGMGATVNAQDLAGLAGRIAKRDKGQKLDILLGKEIAQDVREFGRIMGVLSKDASTSDLVANSITVNFMSQLGRISRLFLVGRLFDGRGAVKQIDEAYKRSKGMPVEERANFIGTVVNGLFRPVPQVSAQLADEGAKNAAREVEALGNRLTERIPQMTTPSASSGIGAVDVTQPLNPNVAPVSPAAPATGTNVPVPSITTDATPGANIRQMATNNPEVARALGIRGATAGLL
tara:strand:- start:84 stop:3044 length:2961 start_codon:yes stop_codon:yes gene_type:complete